MLKHKTSPSARPCFKQFCFDAFSFRIQSLNAENLVKNSSNYMHGFELAEVNLDRIRIVMSAVYQNGANTH